MGCGDRGRVVGVGRRERRGEGEAHLLEFVRGQLLVVGPFPIEPQHQEVHLQGDAQVLRERVSSAPARISCHAQLLLHGHACAQEPWRTWPLARRKS